MFNFPNSPTIGQKFTPPGGVEYTWDGKSWLLVPGPGSGANSPVTSVNTQVGDVVLTHTDVGAAATNHLHAISDVTGLQIELDGKSPVTHTHAPSALPTPTATTLGGVYAATGADSEYVHGIGTDGRPIFKVPTPPSGSNGTPLPAGTILFSDGTKTSGDTGALFWDINNRRLGVGTQTPIRAFEIRSPSGYVPVVTGSVDAGWQFLTDTNSLDASVYISTLSGGTYSLLARRTPYYIIQNQTDGGLVGVNVGGAGNETARFTSDSLRLFTMSTIQLGTLSIQGRPGMACMGMQSGDNSKMIMTALDQGGGFIFGVNGSGVIFSTQQSINSTSDIRLKENIRDFDAYGLDAVCALQPRVFDWKDGHAKDVVGFVAQEVEEVVPFVVSEGDFAALEGMKTIATTDLIPVLVNAIKELAADIADLKAQIGVA